MPQPVWAGKSGFGDGEGKQGRQGLPGEDGDKAGLATSVGVADHHQYISLHASPLVERKARESNWLSYAKTISRNAASFYGGEDEKKSRNPWVYFTEYIGREMKRMVEKMNREVEINRWRLIETLGLRWSSNGEGKKACAEREERGQLGMRW